MKWTDQRLQRLFARYNRKYFSGALAEWSAQFSDDLPGEYGFCDRKRKRIEIRLWVHSSDRSIRATLIHEMAHAATNGRHGPQWRRKMERLRALGAPTEELDFLVPYSARNVITSFIEYAEGGASWEEAFGDLGGWKEMRDPKVVKQAQYFFALYSRKKRTESASATG